MSFLNNKLFAGILLISLFVYALSCKKENAINTSINEPVSPNILLIIADDIGIECEQINVKATTTERLGFTGRGEGIAAEAVCLITKV